MSMIVNVPTGTTSVDSIATNPLMQGFSETCSVNFDNLLRQCYAVADQSDARKDSSANTKTSSGQMQRETAKKSTDESGTAVQKQSVSDTRDGKPAKGSDNIQKRDADQSRKNDVKELDNKNVREQKFKEDNVSDETDKRNENVDKSMPSEGHKRVSQDNSPSVAATVSEDATAAVNLDEYAQVNIDDAVLEDADVLVDNAAETDTAAEVSVSAAAPSDDSSVLAQNEERTAYIQTLNASETGYDNSFMSMPGEILSMLREARSVSSECVAQQENATVSAAELAAASRSNGVIQDADEQIIGEDVLQTADAMDGESAESIAEQELGESAIFRQLLARSSGIAAENSKAAAVSESADIPADTAVDSVNVAASGSTDSLEQNGQPDNGASDNRSNNRENASANIAQKHATPSKDYETDVSMMTDKAVVNQTVDKSQELQAAKISEKTVSAGADQPVAKSEGQIVAKSADQVMAATANQDAKEIKPEGERILTEQHASAQDKNLAAHEEIRTVSSDSQSIRLAQQDQPKNLQTSGSKASEVSAEVSNLADDNAEVLQADKKVELSALSPKDGENGDAAARIASKDIFQKSFVATLREAMLNGHQTREGNDVSLSRAGTQDIRQQAETGISSGSLGISSGSFAEAKSDASVSVKGVFDISAAHPMDKAMNAKTLNPLEAAKEMQKPLRMSQSYEENARQISEKINIMIARNLKTAEVNLDPLNLGKMRININMSEEGVAKVGMVVQNAETKDVIYESLGKLKEALQEAGIKLGDADVKHDDGRGAQASQNEGGSQTNENHSGKMAGVVADESAEEHLEAEIVADDLSSAVNYYA